MTGSKNQSNGESYYFYSRYAQRKLIFYNLVDESSLSTTPSADDASRRPFRPGDHVWMNCEAAGGVRYQHHGVVLYTNENEQLLKIADFTAPNSGTFALPDSVTSGSTLHSHHRVPDWHGVRVTTYENVSEWQREEYEDMDEDVLVLNR
eukprot:3218046-Ditylum_brightwellii.AAC.1